MQIVEENVKVTTIWISLGIFITYYLSLVCLNCPSPLFSVIKTELDVSVSAMATVHSVQTFGVAIGKIPSGFAADLLGGSRCIYGSLIAMVLCLIAMSFSQTYLQIILSFPLLELFGSPLWPACAVIIRGWFPTNQLTDAFWVLSLASRAGDMSGKVYVFFSCLQSEFHFFLVFFVPKFL